MRMIVAHIAGIPIEEAVVMSIPVIGASYAVIMARLRSRRRFCKRD